MTIGQNSALLELEPQTSLEISPEIPAPQAMPAPVQAAPAPEQAAPAPAEPVQIRLEGADPVIVHELVTLLAEHPGGLRRWSVMQAIRRNRSRTSRQVSLRFESEIERVFRTLCAEGTEPRIHNGSRFLFYRPEGKAGEVWAIRPDHARAWNANPQSPGLRAASPRF